MLALVVRAAIGSGVRGHCLPTCTAARWLAMYWNQSERLLTYRCFVAGEGAADFVRRAASEVRAAAGWRGWLRPLPLEGSPETILVATRSVPCGIDGVRAQMMIVASSGPPGARLLAFKGADGALVLDHEAASLTAVERWIADFGYDPSTFVGVVAGATAQLRDRHPWIRLDADALGGVEPLLSAVAEACERQAMASIGALRPRRGLEPRPTKPSG